MWEETYPAHVLDGGEDNVRDRRGKNEEDKEVVPPLESGLALLEVGPAPGETRRRCICGHICILPDTAETMPVEGGMIDDAAEERSGGQGTSKSGKYTSAFFRTRGRSSGQETLGLIRIDG